MQLEPPMKYGRGLDAHTCERRVLRTFRWLASLLAMAPLICTTQPAVGATSPARSVNAALAPGALKTAGNADHALFNAIFDGQFDQLQFEQHSTYMKAIASGYMQGFSRDCIPPIPPNFMEIIDTECARSLQRIDQYGVASESCLEHRDVRTGIYVDRQVYAAVNNAPIRALGDNLTEMFNSIQQGRAVTMAKDWIQLKLEALDLAKLNGCSSPVLRRFKDNLMRFALGQQGIRPDGTIAVSLPKLAEIDMHDLETKAAAAGPILADDEGRSLARVVEIFEGFVQSNDPEGMSERYQDLKRMVDLNLKRRCTAGEQKACSGYEATKKVLEAMNDIMKNSPKVPQRASR